MTKEIKKYKNIAIYIYRNSKILLFLIFFFSYAVNIMAAGDWGSGLDDLIGDGSYDRTCGAVDYTYHSEGLMDMTAFVIEATLYLFGLLYAIASIFSLYNSIVIFFKMSNGEDGVTKDILKLFGAIIFLLAASFVLPAFFGFDYMDHFGI